MQAQPGAGETLVLDFEGDVRTFEKASDDEEDDEGPQSAAVILNGESDESVTLKVADDAPLYTT